MSINPRASSMVAPSKAVSPAYRTPSKVGLSRPVQPGTRTIEIAALRRDGSPYIAQMKVPSLPLFESAFSAFARGTTLLSTDGDIAIEDLQPGDRLWTSSGAPARVMWIGSSSFSPSDVAGRRTPLVRIMSDTFGMGRPDSYLTFGPHARILQTPPHLRSQNHKATLLTPVQEFIDMVNVIEITPPTPVKLFHIVLDRHAAIRAGGLECETFHPGSQATRRVSHAMRDLFLSLFPHISHVTDFGPLAHPRAPELDPVLEAAGY